MQRNTIHSCPCDRCRRVAQPAQCENKRCQPWQTWFLSRWALIHGYWQEKEQRL